MFRPCSRYVFTMLKVCFDCARGKFQSCSKYVPTVHKVGFDRRSRYVSTVLGECFAV